MIQNKKYLIKLVKIDIDTLQNKLKTIEDILEKNKGEDEDFQDDGYWGRKLNSVKSKLHKATKTLKYLERE
jgi:hypothetical protein